MLEIKKILLGICVLLVVGLVGCRDERGTPNRDEDAVTSGERKAGASVAHSIERNEKRSPDIVSGLGSIDPKTCRAFLVGVDEYETLPPLEYASSDVRKIRDALLEIGLDAKNIRLFVSDGRVRERPSRERILQAFDEMLSETDGEATVLVALSGHGFETASGAAAFCPVEAFFYQIDYVLVPQLPEDTVYFHAHWRREKCTELAKDYTIIDGIRGRGHYVGTYVALTALERSWWGEGELKFYIDGDQEYPTICGTGMEDYFGGAWSFGETQNGRMVEKTYGMPQFGYPFYARDDELINNPYHNSDCLPMRGFYRWHLSDPILFEKDLRVTMQQIGTSFGGLFERQDDVCSVAYWYQSEPHNGYKALPTRKDRLPR